MNQSTRTCCICDSSIDHLRSIAKYCSRTCVEKARSLRDPGRRSATAKARKLGERNAREPRPCAGSSCDAMIPIGSARDRIYCSARCRDGRYRAEVRSVRYAPGSDLYARHRRASSEWKKENALSNRISKSLRDARKRDTQVAHITPAQISARFAVFGFRCWMCRAPWEHIDHVKPLAKGGPHILANLRPACRRCNQAKNDTWPLAKLI